jgi:hypothetical protein
MAKFALISAMRMTNTFPQSMLYCGMYVTRQGERAGNLGRRANGQNRGRGDKIASGMFPPTDGLSRPGITCSAYEPRGTNPPHVSFDSAGSVSLESFARCSGWTRNENIPSRSSRTAQLDLYRFSGIIAVLSRRSHPGPMKWLGRGPFQGNLREDTDVDFTDDVSIAVRPYSTGCDRRLRSSRDLDSHFGHCRSATLPAE